MLKRLLPLLLLILTGLLPPPALAADGAVLRIVVDGAISPASAAHVTSGIRHAEDQNMQAVVLQMDTPGGLSSSMRDIIKAIMASKVPVIGYVAPSGSRAASAGTYILYACHVAAMAPATNLGAATPIQLINPAGEGQLPNPAEAASATPRLASPETRKALNDAVAYIRALAEQRGRNADWAEQAVREAATLGAQPALAAGVIDLVADSTPALLAALDGRSVQVRGGAVTLATAGAELVPWKADWRTRFLAVIANPSVAYLLLLIGMFGLLLEGYHPGAIVPGVVGAICLLLALYAFQLLPVSFAGLALMLLGVLLMVAEVMVPTYGALGLGGVVAFVIGSVVLMDTDIPGYSLPVVLVAGVSLATALLMLGVGWMAVRSLKRPPAAGAEQMIGMPGTVLRGFAGAGHGRVRVHGEDWQATGSSDLQPGQAVRVTAIDGLSVAVVADDDPDYRFAGEA